MGGSEDAGAVDGVDDFIDGRGAGVVDGDGEPLCPRVVGRGGGVAEAGSALDDYVDVVERDAAGRGSDREIVAGAGEFQRGSGGAGACVVLGVFVALGNAGVGAEQFVVDQLNGDAAVLRAVGGGGDQQVVVGP